MSDKSHSLILSSSVFKILMAISTFWWLYNKLVSSANIQHEILSEELHKIIHNNVDLQLGDHLDFNNRTTSVSTRHHNPISIKIPTAKTKCFQMSFFPNTARDWNKLPYTITSIPNSKVFQNKLKSKSQQNYD